MYQPRIRDDLIRQLYQEAKARGIRMTTLINQLVETALARKEGWDGNTREPSPHREKDRA